MEHSEGGHQERRPQIPQHYPQQQQQEEQDRSLGGIIQQLPPGGQHPRSQVSQQQLQQHAHEQYQLYLQRDQHPDQHQGGVGIRHPYNPSQSQPGDNTLNNMSAAAPIIDPHRQNEYLSASMVVAAQQQQYLQHHQQQQYEAAVATAGGDPRLASAIASATQQQQQQQQYAQTLSYQQHVLMRHMAETHGGTHPQLGSTTQQSHQNIHNPGVTHPSILGGAVGVPQHRVQMQQTQHRPPQHNVQLPHAPYIQPRVGRLQADRPLIKLTVSLIDTYKCINTLYYQEREARRAVRATNNVATTSTTRISQQPQQSQSGSNVAMQPQSQTQQRVTDPAASSQNHGTGTNNNGWDDDNYDYIIRPGEIFYNERYKIMERIGKGSFGQVVRAVDLERDVEVAIKIIKSKKPFLMQARTEIELLNHLNEKDPNDQHNIGESSYILQRS